MTYSSGTLIQATDYNNLAWGGTQGTYTASPTNIAYVMGVGSGAIGYGQAITAINTVAAAGSVTAVQWSGLLTTLNAALGHQSGSGVQLSVSPTITTGNKITYFSTVATAVTTINTNAALYAANGSTTTGSTFTVNLTTGVATALSGITDRFVTFASSQQARYFFNAGGYLNFYCSAVDNTGNGSGASFVRMINAMGGVTGFRNTANNGRTGSGLTLNTNNTGLGYRNILVGAESVIVAVTDTTSPYTADTARIADYTNANDTTLGANGNVPTFRVGYNVAAHASWDDAINVTLSTRVDIVYPESTYLTTNSWGTPVVS